MNISGNDYGEQSNSSQQHARSNSGMGAFAPHMPPSVLVANPMQRNEGGLRENSRGRFVDEELKDAVAYKNIYQTVQNSNKILNVPVDAMGSQIQPMNANYLPAP